MLNFTPLKLVMTKNKDKEKSKIKEKLKSYQKDKRDILKRVQKLRKIKKDGE